MTTNTPSQIPTNLEEVGKDVVGSEITRKGMAKLCSTRELLGWDVRDLLVWHHRLKYCTLNYMLRLYNREIITNKNGKVRTPPPLCHLPIW